MNRCPAIFILDDENEAFECHFFCSVSCRAAEVALRVGEKFVEGNSDVPEQTVCETCLKPLEEMTDATH